MAKKTILILVPNVWGDGVKLYQHDVVSVDEKIADLLVKNKQAKITKDDETVVLIEDGSKILRVEND